MNFRTASLALLLLLPSFVLQARPQPGPGTQESQVQADDGQSLAVWSRVPAQPRGTILLVHGRTWSSLPNFDLQVPGEPADSRSVLAALARAGYAAYALDLRGYGASARDRSGWNTPERAVADVQEVLAWVAARHPQLPPPALLGYSNGARVALLVAQAQPKAVSGLVLYGFPDDVDVPAAASPSPAKPPRERTTAEGAGSDFITAGAYPPAVREAYVTQALAADPVRTDWRASEQFAFHPERVVGTPVLLIRGVGDPLARQAENARLYARLGSEDRSWVTLPHADHVAHVEDTHAAWVDAIVGFLSRPR
jgi:alpha-beta hydrolase superfamily lysophospholipase